MTHRFAEDDRYRVKCLLCSWRGVRKDHLQCECYDIWGLYCRPWTPGPGCPRGIVWGCPQCQGTVVVIGPVGKQAHDPARP